MQLLQNAERNDCNLPTRKLIRPDPCVKAVHSVRALNQVS